MSDNYILSYGLGDWFDYGPGQPGESQLTPKSLRVTAIYYYDVKLLSSTSITLKDQYLRREERILLQSRFPTQQVKVMPPEYIT